MTGMNMNERSKALEGIRLSAGNAGKLTVGTQSVHAELCKRDKVSVVICGRVGYEAALGFMLGENLADAIMIEPELDPYAVMRTAISVNYGDRGVLLICGSSEEEKSVVMAAGGLLEESGFNNEVVYVEDCIAPGGTEQMNAGYFHCVKIAGAAAACGMTLKETYYTVRKARNLVKSISVRVALTSGGRGRDDAGTLFGEGTMEKIAFQLRQASRARTGDTVCTYISGAGGVSLSELGRVNYQLYRSLTERGIAVHDALINPVPVGAANADIAISMMLLPDELKKYYDMPCSALYCNKT